MKKEDSDFLWRLMPDWVKEQPEGLDCLFYATLTREGDIEIGNRVKEILFNNTEQENEMVG